MIRSAALLALLASPAAAQIVSPLAFGSSAPDTSNLATKADVANVQALIPSTAGLATTSALSTEIAARIAAISAIPAAPVASVNGLTGNVALTIPAAYTDAQALVAARGVTSLTSPNIAMPNGANLAHTIYQSRPSGGFLTISGTAETTVFAATGDGSLTIQPAAMFVGARFHLHDRGRATTGLANVSTIASKLKIGSTTLVTGTTLGLPASVTNIPFWSDIDCKVLSVGTSGSMLCYGGLHYGATASSGALVMTDMSNVTAVTINTTVAQTWDATVQLSSLIGSPSIIVYDAFIIQEN